ncbi:MAG: aldehyde dehydrogenase family protein [Leucobacter sp.]
MVQLPFAAATVWSSLAAPSEARARAWRAELRSIAAESSDEIENRNAALARTMREDPEHFEFTRRLLELVVGTEDAFTSALSMRTAVQEMPTSLPVRDRLAMRAGGAVSLGLPWAVMPVARRWLRDRVSRLVLSAKLPSEGDPGQLSRLAEALRRQSEAGLVPVVQPLGDRVHGPVGASAEAARLASLAAHPMVGHLVVDPARLVPGGSDWSADDDVVRAVESLRYVFEAAAVHGTTIHLEARSVRWARLIPGILMRGLADSAFDRVRVGARLFAELPESQEHYDRLSGWAQRRVAEGGAPAEVVIGLSGVAGEERVASILSGLAVPVLEEPVEVSAQLLRLIESAMHPGRAAVLKPVIASEDTLVLAAAYELAEHLGSSQLFAVQLRSGVAPQLATVLREKVAETRLVMPVVPPREFGAAVDLLVGLAAEAADPGPRDRLGTFRAAVARAAEPAPASHRTQLRSREWDPTVRDSALFYRPPEEPAKFDTGGLTAAVLGLTRGDTGELQLEEFAPPRVVPAVSESGFANEPPTDASVATNRSWVREVLGRAVGVRDGREGDHHGGVGREHVSDAERARQAGERWAAQPYRTRATLLRRTALAVAAARDRLLQTLAVDTGAPAAELDAEINGIVDTARYCALLSERLQTVRGATFVPDPLVLLTAADDTPFSTQASAVLASLAAGSGVLWAVPKRHSASAVALLEEWQAGGLPPGVVVLEAVEGVAVSDTRGDAASGAAALELMMSSDVDRVVVRGGHEVVHELARLQPDLLIEGWFPAAGSILVTPSADPDAAIDDIVASAFRGIATDTGTARAVVLLGSAGRSRRFRRGLADAVRMLRVGDTAMPAGIDPLAFEVGPLPHPPSEAGLRALTRLERGEEWLIEPRQLDDEGLLWSPGVRADVSPASRFWSDARGLPVIGLLHAHSMGEALKLQNSLGDGTTAGLQSNDADEVLAWLNGVEAATLSINRPTTGARVERQPVGGWEGSVVGLPALSGGPNCLLPLGSWRAREGTRSETLHLRGLEPEVRQLIEATQQYLGYEDFDLVRRAALADELAWSVWFGVTRDAVGLGVERNVMRYWPVSAQLRFAEGAPLARAARVLAAALLTRAPVSVSTGVLLPPEVTAVLERRGIEVSLERDDSWLQRIAVSGPVLADGTTASRIRLVGGNAPQTADWLGGVDRVALWAEPVTMAGPVELLTLLREQSISARANRHGLAIPVPGLDELLEP